MASLTKITRYKRAQRDTRMGAKRKARIRREGTTPAFAIHTPEADANAPAEQLSPAARGEASKS